MADLSKITNFIAIGDNLDTSGNPLLSRLKTLGKPDMIW